MALDAELIGKRFGLERRLFLSGSANLAMFAPFWPIYMPGQNWPDNSLSQNFYSKNWHCEDFYHVPSEGIINVYAGIELFCSDQETFAPRVYHIAFKRSNAVDAMWRPFGTLIGARGRTQLISESGDFQRLSDTGSPSRVVFETYFGPGSADFRIVSLHRFSLQITTPSSHEGSVRFLA